MVLYVIAFLLAPIPPRYPTHFSRHHNKATAADGGSGSIGIGSVSPSGSESMPHKDKSVMSPSALVSALHSHSNLSRIDPTSLEAIGLIHSLRARLAPRYECPHYHALHILVELVCHFQGVLLPLDETRCLDQ
jgi:hypothetical protein